jgi:hypothetical protein
VYCSVRSLIDRAGLVAQSTKQGLGVCVWVERGGVRVKGEPDDALFERLKIALDRKKLSLQDVINLGSNEHV